MTAEEALKFIHEKVWQGSRPGLSRTAELLSKMGRPQDKLRFVHIAGTNGKGSVAAMLASVFQSAGLKTGLYTSPFISCFNERMQINGSNIPDELLGAITEFCAPLAMSMEDRPTEFELVTAIAFEFFAREGCDVVVLETGMGGRLDSTNVIENPLCSVITNIGLDHTVQLGGTLEEIAGEKAGIIKPNCPTVCYDLPQNVLSVIEDRCKALFSPLYCADFSSLLPISDGLEGQCFSYKQYEQLKLPLLGVHQQKNAAVVLETVEVLRRQGIMIDTAAIYNGFLKTVWPARFEILSTEPYFVVDGGHNPQCAETVYANLINYFPGKKRIIMLGVLADKDYMGLAGILNQAADGYVTVSPMNTRALHAKELAEKLKSFGKPVFAADSIENGIEKARALAGRDGMVCAVGSLYSAGEVRAHFGK